MKTKFPAWLSALFPRWKRVTPSVSHPNSDSAPLPDAEQGWLQRFLRPGDLVFDVGANMGQKTELFLSCGARVVCVEPQPDCVQRLKARHASSARVTILPKGLADKPGVMEMQICSSANTISTFSEAWKHGRFSDYQWDKTLLVAVTTLDELIACHGMPRYCKIDVEGFEETVLKGLSRPVPCLSFEFAREFLSQARKCVSYLESIGYEEFNFMLGEEQRMVLSPWADASQIFLEIEKSGDPLLWGDIYARQPSATD